MAVRRAARVLCLLVKHFTMSACETFHKRPRAPSRPSSSRLAVRVTSPPGRPISAPIDRPPAPSSSRSPADRRRRDDPDCQTPPRRPRLTRRRGRLCRIDKAMTARRGHLRRRPAGRRPSPWVRSGRGDEQLGTMVETTLGDVGGCVEGRRGVVEVGYPLEVGVRGFFFSQKWYITQKRL